jgi:uncharacterized damage-inducible protein DinB
MLREDMTMRISEALLPEFDQEMANTRKVLERCPEDKYGWKPHERSFSMGALATHLANMPEWGAMTISSDSFDYAPPGAPPYKEEPFTSRQALLERFDKTIAAMRTALEGASNEDLMKSWSLLAGGQTLFTMPKVAVLRGMIFNHIVHHRGQMTVYLRLNDVPVPALYGPSADEAS